MHGVGGGGGGDSEDDSDNDEGDVPLPQATLIIPANISHTAIAGPLRAAVAGIIACLGSMHPYGGSNIFMELFANMMQEVFRIKFEDWSAIKLLGQRLIERIHSVNVYTDVTRLLNEKLKSWIAKGRIERGADELDFVFAHGYSWAKATASVAKKALQSFVAIANMISLSAPMPGTLVLLHFVLADFRLGIYCFLLLNSHLQFYCT